VWCEFARWFTLPRHARALAQKTNLVLSFTIALGDGDVTTMFNYESRCHTMGLPDSDEMKGAEKQGRAVQVVGQFLKRVRDMTRDCHSAKHDFTWVSRPLRGQASQIA
jgi:hypothetical protein